MSTSTRQLAAIMFTDMVGFTALMQDNEQLALQKREKHQQLFENALSRYEGKLLQYYGDGTMSIFTSSVNAILAAIEMQTKCRLEKIDLRIGIHIGDVITDEKGIYGDSVNIASRLESLAVPGSIFISDKLFDDIKNHDAIKAKPLGFFELKNVKNPIHVYAISNKGIVVPTRDEVKGKVKQIMNSIAVLPFASLSSDPENEFFCDGITEELLNVLSKIEGLQVTSRTSSFALKSRNEDVREIAARLNVEKVLEGSVRKSGNKVRITAQLINGADGYHLWSETYDRSLEDIFTLQDDIAREIVNRFRINLNEEEHKREVVTAPTENLEAYKKYLLGLHLWNKQTMVDIHAALMAFNEAAGMDPSFINPLVQIININAFYTHATIITVQEGRRICMTALEKMEAINAENPLTLVAQGLVAFYFDWNLEKAEELLLKAIAKNPNLANAYLGLSWVYAITKRKEKMLQMLKSAQRLDPLGGDTLAGASELCLIAGLFEEGEYFCREALEVNPMNIYAATISALIAGFRVNWMQAAEQIGKIYSLAPDFTLVMSFYGYVMAKSGNREEALKIISKLQARQAPPDSPSLEMLIAIIQIGLGNKEEFYAGYHESINKHIITCLYYYQSPIMIELHAEKRMIDIGKMLKLI